MAAEKFEIVGRQHIQDLINSLEAAEFDWVPFFYHTLSFEGDMELAANLRKEFNLPRTKDEQDRIDVKFEDMQFAITAAERKKAVHEMKMKQSLFYALAYRIGLIGDKPTRGGK